MASKRLRAHNGKEDEEAKMDMSPMIDMVFLLLIFFIVVSSPVIVKMDPSVDPSIANNSKSPEEKRGRVVINIHEDGTVYPEEFTDGSLESDQEITEYVKQRKEEIDPTGYKARLHLRGHKSAVFKHSRRVIKAAAEAGVDQVIFAVYPFKAQ